MSGPLAALKWELFTAYHGLISRALSLRVQRIINAIGLTLNIVVFDDSFRKITGGDS